MMIVDKTGASVVITWDWDHDQLLVTRKDNSFQVIGVGTKYIMPRLNTAGYVPTVDSFRDFLENTTMDSTAYSNIYDLRQGIVYVYNRRDFKNGMQFSLEQELAKERHAFFLKDLFSAKQ